MTARHDMGETLRRQRERRGIALETIASRTKLTVSLFRALERGDCSRWPAGIYARSYLREYAETIGLDAEHVLERVGQCCPDVFWPERNGEAGGRSADLAADTIRLRLDPSATRRGALVAGRVAWLAIELLTLVLFAGIAWVAGASFWMSLAVVLAGHYTLSALVAGTPSWPRSLATMIRSRQAVAIAPPRDGDAPADDKAEAQPPQGAREAPVWR